MPLITDPIDLKLDENDDIVFENGDLVFTRGIDAIVQQCRISLKMFQGEWFLDLDAGIPYWESILGQKPSLAIQAAKIYFTSALLAVDGVDEVLKMDISYTGITRQLNITWQVSTVFGETPEDEITLRVAEGSE